VRRMNFAPTAKTIIVALVLMLLGLLGTYGTVVPDSVGILAFLGASAILLFGMVTRLF
jgi:CBS-domain-containing membrane protein